METIKKNKIIESFASIIGELTLEEIDETQGALKIQLSKLESDGETYTQEELDEILELDSKTYSEIFGYLISKLDKTQSEIAEMMGVPQSTISQWCTGKRQPKMDTISKIVELTGKTPYLLLGDPMVCEKETQYNPKKAKSSGAKKGIKPKLKK